jgi:hypothetical protein
MAVRDLTRTGMLIVARYPPEVFRAGCDAATAAWADAEIAT